MLQRAWSALSWEGADPEARRNAARGTITDMSHAAAERQALVEALIEAGDRAPTLCEGWTTHDLAAHLVSRERRPDAGPGLLIPLFAGHTERVRLAYRERPYAELVRLIQTGPPRSSAFALPGVDAAANLAEHFIHCEDVRRAASSWQPRVLDADRQDALWKVLSRMARSAFRRSSDSVRLVRPDGAEIAIGSGGSTVRLHGEPAELLLYAFNRRGQAEIEFDGDPDAVDRFRALKMGL